MLAMDDFEPDPLKTVTVTTRHKCAACFQQFKKKEHLVAHMKKSFHSVHQPKCGVCQKHCKSFESLREHLTGPLAKARCSSAFAQRGCLLCLKLFDNPNSLSEHKESCLLTAPALLGTNGPCMVSKTFEDDDYVGNGYGPESVAMDCQMVGCGIDGSIDLLARVCLVNEEEKLIFHAYVEPQVSVTNYRYEQTGLTEDYLKDAMPLKEARDKISEILYHGESIGKARLDGGKARLLVGHNLQRNLDCLLMNYPDQLLRDTASYPPLMKTNLVSHSLKYLTKTYLGYDIQSIETHDSFEDCVSVMRLYKRMRSQEHSVEKIDMLSWSNTTKSRGRSSPFSSRTSKELEIMSPEELFQISRSEYQCWCLDSQKQMPR